MSSYVITVDLNITGDPGYMSGHDTDTTSLASIVKSHIYENGRRYHGWNEGRYAMPNDEEEQDRMDLQHHICLMALGGCLYKAPPLEDPKRILDVGTGNGIWAIDCGDIYPDAQVIGVDFSPIQPKWVPPNVSFEVDDVEQLWTHPDNSFDFIHVRQLAGFIDDWPKMYSQAMRVLKPGGTIEFQDFLGFGCDDGTLPEDGTMMKWYRAWMDGVEIAGRATQVWEHAQALTKAGFEQVKYDPVKIPVGTWAKDKSQKEIGFYMRQHMVDGCESISLAIFTRFLGLTKNEVDAFNAGFREDLCNKNYHSYANFHITYGKKPMGCNGGSVSEME